MIRLPFYLLLIFLSFSGIVFSNPLLPSNHPKVYDCFLFYNELELLDVRLDEMYPKVDKFVLVESMETFRGTPKPLYFQENKERFAKYADKIIYVCVEPHPEFSNAWEREFYQRNQIMRGLEEICSNNDVILVSDLDEIIRAAVIDTIVVSLTVLKMPYVYCDQLFYRFFINQREKSRWIGSSATTFKTLKTLTPEKLRELRFTPIKKLKNGSDVYPYISNAGWHFSYMGGHNRVLQKIGAFSHAEYDTPSLKEEQVLHDFLCMDCFIVEIDDSYPSYILRNIEQFYNNGFIYQR